MFNEGPIPPEMIPSIRDLIADLEGYRKNTGKGDAMRNSREEDLNQLAILLMIHDQDEKIAALEERISNTSASVGFLTLVMIAQIVAIIYLFIVK